MHKLVTILLIFLFQLLIAIFKSAGFVAETISI